MQGRYRGDMGARLHGGAVRDRLVRVDAAAERLAVEEVGEQLADLGDACGAAHEHHLVHLALLEARVLEHALDLVRVRVRVRVSLGLTLAPLTVSRQLSKAAALSDSNLARVRVTLRSMPSAKASTSSSACVGEGATGRRVRPPARSN